MNKIITILIIVFLALGTVSADTKTNALNNMNKVLIGACYYPWYRAQRGNFNDSDSNSQWKNVMRTRLVPQQKPKLGLYASDDPEVVADHIDQSKRGNISFWAVSWWGPDTQTDKVFKNNILKHEKASGLKYAVLYESTGRLGSFQMVDYSNLFADFEYIEKTYFENPNYLKINDKPVVFIYLTRVYFRNKGGDELARLRKQHPNIYLIGDEIFGPKYSSDYAKLWDAVTAYDVYGQSIKSGAAKTAIKTLKNTYSKVKTLANSVGTGFVPAISPGYNDRAVRKGHPGRCRYFTDDPESKEGDIFRSMIKEVALKELDPLADNVIMVTSFNEWFEDSQIEASEGTKGITSKDDSDSGDYFTEGQKYTDYGYLYLDILAEETKKFSNK